MKSKDQRNAFKINDMQVIPDIKQGSKSNVDSRLINKEADLNFTNNDNKVEYSCPVISLKKRLKEVKVDYIDGIMNLFEK